MHKKDLLILSIIVSVVLILFLAIQLNEKAPPSHNVSIYVDGVFYTSATLGQKEDVVIKQKDGKENIVSFTQEGFYMKHSTCDNQACIKQGEVTLHNYNTRALTTQIICLPNRVTVELDLLENMKDDNLPDV